MRKASRPLSRSQISILCVFIIQQYGTIYESRPCFKLNNMFSQIEVGFHYDHPLKQQSSDKHQQQEGFGHLDL